jgi:uncharacterized protein YbcI
MSSTTRLSIDVAPLGYCPQSIDTHITADLVRFHLYRQRTTVERFGLDDDWQRAKIEAGLSHLG